MQMMTLLVFLISGKLVDVSEFVGANFDNCPVNHYHAASGGFVTPLDGSAIIPDPAPTVCGYGFAALIPTRVVPVSPLPDADFDGVPDSLEMTLGTDMNNPDSNMNGILDGDEDHDSDGLSTNREFYEFFTDPNDSESVAEGVTDALSISLAWADRTHTVVPTMAGSFRNTGISESEIRLSIDYLNDIGSNYNTFYQGIWVGTDVDAGDFNQDGFLTLDDFSQSNWYFNTRMDSMGEFGVYLGFGQEDYLDAFNGVDGATQLGDFSYYAEWKLTESLSVRAQYAANIFAHEYLHDQLAVHPLQGSADDTPQNVMQPVETRLDYIRTNGIGDTWVSDTTLSMTQYLKTFKGQGRVFYHDDGVTTRLEQQRGRFTDTWGDNLGGDPIFDIGRVLAVGENDQDLFAIDVTLNAPFQATHQMQLRYSFDIDDNTGTGITSAGNQGIDRELEVYLDYTNINDPQIHSYLWNYDTFERKGYRQPFSFQLNVTFGSADEPEVPIAQNVLMQLSKDELGITGTGDVPVYIQSEPWDMPFTANDTAQVTFDLDAWMSDPTVTLPDGTANSGDMLAVTVAGLTPSTGFDLMFDGTVALSDTTDAQGDFSGNVTVPMGVGGTVSVVAADTTGAFGATIVAVPEPGAIPTGLAGVAAAIGLRRMRGRQRRFDA